MNKTSKLKIKWVIITIVASVSSWFFLLHGGVGGEAAARNNEPTLFYQIEVWFGFLLAWPVMIYGKLRSLLGFGSTLGLEVLLFQCIGYTFLYKLDVRRVEKKHNKNQNLRFARTR